MATANASSIARNISSSIRWDVLAGPVLILIVLAMMVLKLPPFALDAFFTANIVMAVMVLMVTMFTKKPLDFAAFPSILLFATLLRLSLNVASTRIVLMEGHAGGAAAGKVIESFGQFLVGGSFAVGLVVFLILVIINFVVITKGAGRIAEVGARFMLDSMPGKQMAIDADLAAGIITEEEAKQRRAEINQESDFYGSMDGASKFVRGDAIAGLIIMAINIIGGLIIGTTTHDLSLGAAAETYIILTIGDGLVAQIPALVISTAAGVMVSRVNTDQDVGKQMSSQLFNNPNVLFLTGSVVGLLGMVPGMPNFIFILFATMLFAGGFLLKRKEKKQVEEEKIKEIEVQASKAITPEVSWDDVSMLDVLGMGVGAKLISMVSRDDAELITEIKGIRKRFAADMGFLPSQVRIRDELDLEQNQYVITINGAAVGKGVVYPGEYFAISNDEVKGPLEGREATDPVYNLPGYWIDPEEREKAQLYKYTVVHASGIVSTHLNHIIHMHAAEIFRRAELEKLLDIVKASDKSLVEDVIPDVVTKTQLQRILQRLLEEEIPINNLRGILDVLSEFKGHQASVEDMLAHVRISMGRLIIQRHYGMEDTMFVMGLNTELENILKQAVANNGAMEPGLSRAFYAETETAIREQEMAGYPTVLVVSHELRTVVSQFLRKKFPDLAVISNMEIPHDRYIEFSRFIGAALS